MKTQQKGNQKAYLCSVCSRGFNSQSVYSRHIHTSHSQKIWSCSLCGFNTKRKDNLARHNKQQKHKDKLKTFLAQIQYQTEAERPIPKVKKDQVEVSTPAEYIYKETVRSSQKTYLWSLQTPQPTTLQMEDKSEEKLLQDTEVPIPLTKTSSQSDPRLESRRNWIEKCQQTKQEQSFIRRSYQTHFVQHMYNPSLLQDFEKLLGLTMKKDLKELYKMARKDHKKAVIAQRRLLLDRDLADLAKNDKSWDQLPHEEIFPGQDFIVIDQC